MSGKTNPKINARAIGRGNVSNDEFECLNGVTGNIQSQISGKIPDAGTTGGTSTAYTATLATRPNPLTSGYTFVCVFHTTNGAAATIALSSGTAQPLWTNGAAAPAGAIIAGTPYVCRSDGTRVHLIGTLGIQLKTKFGSYTTSRVVVDDNYVYVDSDTETLRIGDGNAPQIALYGDNTGSNKGCAFHYLGSATGAKHSLYDKNGAEQLRVDENGVTLGNSAFPILYNGGFIYTPLQDKRLVVTSGDYGGSVRLYGENYSGAYGGPAGALAGAARLCSGWVTGSYVTLEDRLGIRVYADENYGTKILSAGISIPTGGAWTTLCAIDGNQTLRFATVTGHGTILLEWDGTTLSKMIGPVTMVVAGSAGATEIAFRVSGGNLQASNGTGTSRNGSSGFSVQH